MRRSLFITLLLAGAAAVLSVHAAAKKADVVFIVVDDLNDWVGVLGGHPQSKTPNIDALAKRGVLFSNAHCNAPTCNPSRKSFLSGLYPKSNGKYFNGGNKLEKDRPPFFCDMPMSGPTSKSAPAEYPYMHQHFKKSGYRVVSGGKMAHGPIGHLVGEESLDAVANRKSAAFNNEGAGYASARRNVWGQYGATNQKDSQTSDYKIAHWAIDQWNTVTDKPLLMTIGIFRPHTPLTVPKAYFEKFPIESIQLPEMPGFDDTKDLPEYAKWIARYTNFDLTFDPRSVHEEILHRGGEEEWKYMVQSYLACINYADTQVGHLLEALKKNPRGRETMIILTGDHGWHLGEKGHWCKSALWCDSTHVPYIVVAPGVAEPGTVNNQPVSLVDTYPTLCDFAGIPKPDHLDGESLIPLLKDPTAKRDAAFISYGPENTALQTERYRYIRYEDGSDELYDHRTDPHEWTNQSNNPEFSELKEQLKASILEFQETTPESNADKPSANKKARPETKAKPAVKSAPTGKYEMRQWAVGKAKAAEGSFIRISVSSKGKDQVELKAPDGTRFAIRMQAMTAEDKAYLESIQADGMKALK
ncbi:Choline-sulfatase [Pontiella desulfatans]|uniref:Choline-sulfatase n=1 Tax=Pontiella desulfatans TaxID=2750659 RepID=A0A6C2U169_PONDE|nr:sulfatase S1_7 [Kiritimatiellales bacterium]VGO13637.1 Choline-sulfatase [Pontiella desulfatans]